MKLVAQTGRLGWVLGHEKLRIFMLDPFYEP